MIFRFRLIMVLVLCSIRSATGQEVKLGNFVVSLQTLKTVSQGHVISNGLDGLGTVSDLLKTPDHASWTVGAMRVEGSTDHGRLHIRFQTNSVGKFSWPIIPDTDADSWALPFFEGVCIPNTDSRWLDFLQKNDGLSATESLSFPAWGVRSQKAMVTYILPQPFNCNLDFDKTTMRLTKTFTAAWKIKSYEVVVEIGGDSLIEPALAFRRWAAEQGQLVLMKDKIRAAPNAARLLGAAQVYLWGEAKIAPADVKNWKILTHLLQSAETPAAAWFAQALSDDAKNAVDEIAKTGSAYEYLAREVTDDLSRVMSAADAPPLSEAFPNCFAPQPWGDGVSIKMLNLLHDAGLDHLCLTLGSLTGAVDKPDFVRQADAFGYLLGPYDSYNTIHKPGSDDPGDTTQFDEALWETGAVIKQDGTKRAGFQKKGYTLNSRAVWPYVARRVDPMLSAAPYTSWFVDCDAFGEFFDDYSPLHPGTEADDLAARRQRLGWLTTQHGLVVGSEGGSALVADRIHCAQGVMTPVIGWDDPDLKDAKSPYFLGRYYPPQGPTVFIAPAKMKDDYQYIYENPKFRVPLYEAAFHDSVVATHHWSAGSLKFSNVASTVELLELLYSAPPLYHLNPTEWKKHAGAIKKHYAVFSPLHHDTALLPLTSFEWLSPDALLQKTTFGNSITVTANFADEPRADIPARSVKIVRPDGSVTLYSTGN